MNSYGTKFRLSIFGESHGELIGVVMDGVPAGISLSADDFIPALQRRKSGMLLPLLVLSLTNTKHTNLQVNRNILHNNKTK